MKIAVSSTDKIVALQALPLRLIICANDEAPAA
jgi:hypothetical protein